MALLGVLRDVADLDVSSLKIKAGVDKTHKFINSLLNPSRRLK